MKRLALTLVALVIFCYAVGEFVGVAEASGNDKESMAIKAVIEKAYINGIFIHPDAAAIRSGFHPQFNMLILKEGKIIKVPLEEWIKKIEARSKMKPPAPAKITYDLPLVDITGDAAVVKIKVYKDAKHIYSDYMSLYKFEDGWKIVNKIFQGHN